MSQSISTQLDEILLKSKITRPLTTSPDEFLIPQGTLLRVYAEGRLVKKVSSVGPIHMPPHLVRHETTMSFFDVENFVFSVRTDDLVIKQYGQLT